MSNQKFPSLTSESGPKDAIEADFQEGFITFEFMYLLIDFGAPLVYYAHKGVSGDISFKINNFKISGHI